MSQVIRVSDNLYKRLEAHASGFDTPSNVVEAVLNAYEGVTTNTDTNISSHGQEIQPANKLDIIYLGYSEEEFK